MVYKIAARLRIGRQGYWILMEIAFPEFFEALGQGDNPNRLNTTLMEQFDGFVEVKFNGLEVRAYEWTLISRAF